MLFFTAMLIRTSVGGASFSNETDTSRNFLDDIIGSLTSAVKEFSGICIHGYNCGGKCAPYEKKGTKKYKDSLDKACLIHDMCLCKARSASKRKSCDEALMKAAKTIWTKEDDCPALNPFCTNNDLASAARDVHNAMAWKGSGKTINCKCKLDPCEKDEDEYEYEEEEEDEEEYEYEEEEDDEEEYEYEE